MTSKAAIVVTTIFEPAFVAGYIANLAKHERRDTDVIVIVDRKTPPRVAQLCSELAREGWSVLCPTLDEQETFLSRFPSMRNRVPYNSDNRRNIGFLMALDRGADVLITIDDDNYCLGDSDFVGEHLHAGAKSSGHATASSDGWLNFCDLLSGSARDPIFPRGFPYFARRKDRTLETVQESPATTAINVGLWLSDPDVDAISRLAQAPRIDAFRGGSLYVSSGTWSPINTQNTALSREAVAAYYYVRMGFDVGGLKIDRYGDILSGYFVQKCVKAKGEAIRVGTPIADHRRTPHNLFKDLYHELAGMVIIEELIPEIIESPISGSTYDELYLTLADGIEEISSRKRGFVWDDGGREFVTSTAEHMRAWVTAVKTIG